MSQVKLSKRQASEPLHVNELNDVKNVLNSLLSPILNQLTVLTETVSTVLSIIDKSSICEKDVRSCGFTGTSIAADVTMMATSLHKLTKNYETIKDQILENQNNVDKMDIRLGNIEKLVRTLVKLENGHKMQNKLMDKMNNIEQLLLCGADLKSTSSSSSQTSGMKPYQVTASVGLDSSMQLITLNSQQDYPNGSWLGDVNSPTSRVRCPISMENLMFINTGCRTAEKMALTLLDYLFTRETLAVSNLSGKSKLGKKQLDPLMVYGIKCHLIHHFNINEKQWGRIKQNMDSKCRSAWKKRKLGEPAVASAYQGFETKSKTWKEEPVLGAGLEVPGSGVMMGSLKAQVIHTLEGDIEVLQATPDQILRFHDLHNIHVLDGDHILPVMNSDAEDSDSMIPLVESEDKSEDEDQLTIIKTEGGDSVGVGFVTEPMLEVLADDSLSMDTNVLIEQV